MKTIIYILCVCLLCPGFLYSAEPAETILGSVTVSGVDSLLREDIARRLLSVKDGIFNEGLIEHDVNTLMDYLRERGWWKASVSASVDSSTGNPVTLTYAIAPGKPVLFGTIKPEMTDDTHVSVPHTWSGLYGNQFSKKELEDTVNEIISQLASGGYPDVSVAPSFNARGDTVNIVLDITAGQRAHIDSVAIQGLTRTKENVIRRELSALPGRPAGPEAIVEASAVIGRLNYIRMEGSPVIDYYDKGNGILVIALSEGSQGSFDGVFGYQPVPGKDSGEMVGKVDIGLANIFGTGRSASVRWENLGANTEDLEMHYLEPWVFGIPYDVSLSFIQEERENRGYIRTSIAAGIGRHIGRLHVDGGFRYEKVSADTLHSTKGGGVNLGAVWTAVDNPMNPSRGIRYGVSWSVVSKRYRFISGRKTQLERTEFDLDHYIPSFSRQTIAVLVRYRRAAVPLQDLGPSDRYWLGGASTIRGYNESMFPALKALWTSIEYRFLTGDASIVFVFADTGYLVNREKYEGVFRKKTRTLVGYGFGLRLQSRAGILGFDYGLGKGDSPGEGKLHVSLRTEF